MEYFKLELGTSKTFYCTTDNSITVIKLISEQRIVLEIAPYNLVSTKNFYPTVHHLAKKCTQKEFENTYELFLQTVQTKTNLNQIVSNE